MKIYYAHSGTREDRADWQILCNHLEACAALAGDRGRSLGLKNAARIAGLFHDFGKYDPAFDRILCGENVRVDHSTAGAEWLLREASPALRPVAEALAYAILGHHAGLPDRRGSESSLDRRIEDFKDRIDPAISNAATADLLPAGAELKSLIRLATGAFDLSVAIRLLFSCLVDADFRDTEAFYAQLEKREPDRNWPSLSECLPEWIRRFDAHMAGFSADSDLNRLRAAILAHIRKRAALKPGLFTLTVPTGGGKTLASLGFALDHAARYGHRRIIYAIPYTSIIDQTAAIFRNLFGDAVLEHHASIEIEKPDEQGRDKMRLAMEDWAAPLVVTTNVQLFESLFAARPSRCRKLQNIAGSVIVLDEAQCLPRKLLIPTLRMIEVLSAHYGCSVVLCTATQPAFDSRQLKQGGLPLEGRELAPDPEGLAQRLRRAKVVRGGQMDDTALIGALSATPQGFVIVNSRAHALELFKAGQAAGTEGLIHLTTRQYPAHRRAILENIRHRLATGAQCRLIATSLIEAGVDLDFPVGWRAEAGLDSCVQAAGRVNRNGLRDPEASTLTIFSPEGQGAPAEVRALADAMARTASRHANLLSPEAIRDWFEDVYWTVGPDRLGKPMADRFVLAQGGTDFPFRTTAADYRMIDSPMVPVIVPGDDKAAAAVGRLAIADVPSSLIARDLQPYTIQIPVKSRAKLVENGHASYHHPNPRGDQFCVLDNPSLYHEDSGLWWEDADYLAGESSLI
ncbi:CRISPR-associated endonuclease Cas3'' [Paracoccus sp. M683]|uniref:CRISPR-associated endonuclease Cas3'' n=1 Tax=Paracoccus sp. M683 TaxID=2594268 RepID=UPI00117CE4C2|nr:CRISPR-associated endonuclease Cas3'' [Paracoccus sp. M683]TRW97855.1 CRISPR-associated endonuclease Cas3'' [Paracoccus sp. M683]